MRKCPDFKTVQTTHTVHEAGLSTAEFQPIILGLHVCDAGWLLSQLVESLKPTEVLLFNVILCYMQMCSLLHN